MSVARAGIEIPRDDCEWRAGDLGNMANRSDMSGNSLFSRESNSSDHGN